MPRPRRRTGTLKPITIMLPEEVVVRVQQVAEQTATPPSVLLRQWIMERIRLDGMDSDAG